MIFSLGQVQLNSTMGMKGGTRTNRDEADIWRDFRAGTYFVQS